MPGPSVTALCPDTSREPKLTRSAPSKFRSGAELDKLEAELLQRHRQTVGQGQPGLDADELQVTAVEQLVLVRDGLEDERRAQLGQRPRVLEPGRGGHRRGEVVEGVVALEEV